MFAIDGPDMDVEPRALGKSPPTPFLQLKKVTADRPPGEQDPCRVSQRSPNHIGKKTAQMQNGGPQGRELSAARVLRAASSKSPQGRERPGTEVAGSEGFQQQEPMGAKRYSGRDCRKQKLPAAGTSKRKGARRQQGEEEPIRGHLGCTGCSIRLWSSRRTGAAGLDGLPAAGPDAQLLPHRNMAH